MDKTITLLGVTYKLSTGETVVDYGLGDLYANNDAPSHSIIEKFTIKDESLSPSLDGFKRSELLPNIEYNARILSISTKSKNKRLTLGVNDQVGTILFKNLTEYWGDDNAVVEQYHVGDTISVCLDTSIDTILAFRCKDVRIIPISKLNIGIGDIVSARISTIEPSLSIWYNGLRFYLNQKDPIAENRIHNHIYYPGKHVKVRVTDAIDKSDGGRYFSFQLIHEHHGYPDIEAGTIYPCTIYKRDKNSSPVAAFYVRGIGDDEEVKYSFVIPPEEIPAGFDGFYPSSIPSKVRISSFDSLGEPVIQFKTLMEELARNNDGEVFEITLVKPYLNESPFRVWKSEVGICGTVLKKMLFSLGDYQPTGLQARFIDGQLFVEKRGEQANRLSVGDIIEVMTGKSFDCGYHVNYEGYTGLLCYPDKDVAEETSMQVNVVYVSERTKIFVSRQIRTIDETTTQFAPNSEQSLQIIADMGDFFVLGDGVRLCILPRKLWDWSNGLAIDSINLNSYYYHVRINEEIQPYVYMAERRSLVKNPWETIPPLSLGDKVKAIIIDFIDANVVVDIFEIKTKVPWEKFSIYGQKFGKILYEIGDEITLQVVSFDKEKRVLELATVESSERLLTFSTDKTKVWTGVVCKILSQGLIVRVGEVLGLVPRRQMLSESSYEVNQTIPLRLLKKDSSCLEFSHLDAIDLTKSCGLTVGQVIPDVTYIGIDRQKIWQSYAYKEYVVQSQAWTSRYFSSDKEYDFYDRMIINQKYKIRISEIVSNGLYAVPALMPDYSKLEIGSLYDGLISQIADEYYMVYIPDLDDTFQILFKEYCDWGLCHFETRKVGEKVGVKLVNYFPKVNFPVFSIKACESDPWINFEGVGIVVVKNLGSPLKNKNLFVDVCGVPVSLSFRAICTLFGRPWVDNAYSFDNVEELLKYDSFEMRVIKFDKTRHLIDLMPHYHAPESVQMARVIRNKSIEPGCWVDCGGGLVGYLPNEEIPKGYKISTFVEKAKIKSYSEKDGYAILSIKDLFAGLDGEKNTDDDNSGIDAPKPVLAGIEVSEDTRLEPGMVVQGMVTGMNKERLFYYVKVGPYSGTIPFNKIVPTRCVLPELALTTKETYDFQIFKIIPKDDSRILLRLCMHTIAPKPNLEYLTVNAEVNVTVLRYSKNDATIVVYIEKANVEGVILKDEIAKAFSMQWKYVYPTVGTKLKATIKSIEKTQDGGISTVILGRVKR